MPPSVYTMQILEVWYDADYKFSFISLMKLSYILLLLHVLLV